MGELVKELEGRFDKVILDSPPLFLSDAAQLSHTVDGILLVARMDFTSRNPVRDLVVDHYLSSLLLGVAVIEPRNKGLFGYGRYGYGKYGYGKYGYNSYEEAS